MPRGMKLLLIALILAIICLALYLFSDKFTVKEQPLIDRSISDVV